jgi:hypothetical protein
VTLSMAGKYVALVRFFTVTIQGMRALARLKSDRRALDERWRGSLWRYSTNSESMFLDWSRVTGKPEVEVVGLL